MPQPPIPFIPGSLSARPSPLGRFLPVLPEGAASSWLKQRLEPGAWVLDPFGSSPRLVIEMARAGFRVLVAANNPVLRALLELELTPPSLPGIQSILAELASTYKGTERLEPHIRGLYETECAECHARISADCFLWERQASIPYGKIYHCPYCSDSGERPVTPADIEKASHFASGGLHRARALERIALPNDPDRIYVEEALAVYPARAVYALFTLINKLDGLVLSPQRRKHLASILLHTCDQANTLWPYPTERERPRQLTIPRRYRENNVWNALEQGAALLASNDHQTTVPPVPYSLWPEYPLGTSGISLFEGRLKDLTSSLERIEIKAVVAALPRPNQAFWTLSALWSGWLWGREAAGAFKSVLRRRRYDWAWHTAALSAALESLTSVLSQEIPVLALTGEAEPGMLASTLIAAEGAGLELQGLALRADSGQAQIHYRKASYHDPIPPASDPLALARSASMDFLRMRGQPANYLSLKAAALAALAENHTLQIRSSSPVGKPDDPKPAVYFSRLQSLLKDTFTFRNGFLRYEGSDQSLEVGQWWLRETVPPPEGSVEQLRSPLSDRVEEAVVRTLLREPGCTIEALEAGLLEAFPGLLAPELELIQTCLFSYARQDPPANGQWRLTPSESPSSRRRDLEEARHLLQQLGTRLGFQVVWGGNSRLGKSPPSGRNAPCLWLDSGGVKRYACYATATAAFGKVLASLTGPAIPALIILPGSRSGLALYKLKTDPRLRAAAEKGWHFIKFRHLRRLVETQNLTAANLEEYLKLDPLETNLPQMRLL